MSSQTDSQGRAARASYARHASRQLNDEPATNWAEQITEQDDGVQVAGVTKQEILEALKLRDAAYELQFKWSKKAASKLAQVSVDAQVDLIDPAPVEQARRLANLKQELLATPVYSYATLAQVRGDTKVSATRTWVSRMRSRHNLFTVNEGGQTLIPAFQLTDDGRPVEELVGLLDLLLAAGVDGWTLWVWLTSTTPLLSGQVPLEVAMEDPERARQAASRFAARQPAM